MAAGFESIKSVFADQCPKSPRRKIDDGSSVLCGQKNLTAFIHNNRFRFITSEAWISDDGPIKSCCVIHDVLVQIAPLPFVKNLPFKKEGKPLLLCPLVFQKHKTP